MFLRNKWLFLTLCLVLLLSGCEKKENPEGAEPVTSSAEESTKAPEETTTQNLAASYDLLGEDEMLIVYEKPIFDDFQPSPGVFVAFGKGGEVLYREENVIYRGPVGRLKQSTPLPLGFPSLAPAGSHASSVSWGIYQISEGKYLVEPKYKSLYQSTDVPRTFISYSEQDGYEDMEAVIDGKETVEEKPHYLLVSGFSYEGEDAVTDGTWAWIAKGAEEVSLCREGEVKETFAGVQILSATTERICLIPSDFEVSVEPEAQTAVYGLDGTLLFRLSDWKEEHPSQYQLLVRDVNADLSLIAVCENGPEERKWLVNPEGEILREISGEENFYFPYEDPDHYAVETYIGMTESAWYEKDGTPLLESAGDATVEYQGKGWFSYVEGEKRIYVSPKSGEEFSVPVPESDESFTGIAGGSLFMLEYMTRDRGYLTDVYDRKGNLVASGGAVTLIQSGNLLYLNEGEEEATGWTGYYGYYQVYDQNGELVYRSPIRENVIWADTDYAVVMRGNYLTLTGPEGEVLFQQLSSSMADD